jgi:hypothetical protein
MLLTTPQVVASLLLNEAPLYVLRDQLAPVAVSLLVNMCARYAGAAFSEWGPLSEAFALVLVASVRTLNRQEVEAAGEQDRRVLIVRRYFLYQQASAFVPVKHGRW